MQRDVEIGRRQRPGAARLGQARHQRQRLLGRFERSRAGLGARPVLDPEDGEQAVAQEFQDLAAARSDRAHHAVEAVVQQPDQVAARQRVGKGGEAAQVGEEQHRLDALDLAALHRARQDTRPPDPGRGRRLEAPRRWRAWSWPWPPARTPATARAVPRYGRRQKPPGRSVVSEQTSHSSPTRSASAGPPICGESSPNGKTRPSQSVMPAARSSSNSGTSCSGLGEVRS